MIGRNKIYLLFIAFAVVYVTLSLATPPDAESLVRYGITAEKARLIKLSVLLPYITIWFAAFYGYAELRKYAHIIKDSRDGQALSTIANGLMIYAVIMPVTAIATTVTNYLSADHPGALATGTIIGNYVDLGLACLAMGYIYTGSKSLASIVPRKVNPLFESTFRSCFLILVSVYSYLMLTNPARQFPTSEVKRAAFYLPDLLLALTIILPSVFIWYCGFQAAHFIYTYSKNVSGKLYRSALGYLAIGVLLIILARISLRFFASLTTLFATSTISFVLGVVYVLLVIIAAGFVVLAIGAKKLKKIEEV